MAFEPFIVTAGLPPDIFAWADDLRRAHYPSERNRLPAHVTLFHAFAPSLRDELGSLLPRIRSEEHTSELQSLMRISNAVFCLKKQKSTNKHNTTKNSKSSKEEKSQ